MSILVLGTVALDNVRTPAGFKKKMLGGSAAHFSMAARLFVPVNLVAIVGKDFPGKHINFLQAKGEIKNTLGIYLSPKEISIAQIKLTGEAKLVPEHLVKFPTGFAVKEGVLRPLSLNGEFFSEKAPWIAPFRQAMKQV